MAEYYDTINRNDEIKRIQRKIEQLSVDISQYYQAGGVYPTEEIALKQKELKELQQQLEDYKSSFLQKASDVAQNYSFDWTYRGQTAKEIKDTLDGALSESKNDAALRDNLYSYFENLGYLAIDDLYKQYPNCIISVDRNGRVLVDNVPSNDSAAIYLRLLQGRGIALSRARQLLKGSGKEKYAEGAKDRAVQKLISSASGGYAGGNKVTYIENESESIAHNIDNVARLILYNNSIYDKNIDQELSDISISIDRIKNSNVDNMYMRHAYNTILKELYDNGTYFWRLVADPVYSKYIGISRDEVKKYLNGEDADNNMLLWHDKNSEQKNISQTGYDMVKNANATVTKGDSNANGY